MQALMRASGQLDKARQKTGKCFTPAGWCYQQNRRIIGGKQIQLMGMGLPATRSKPRRKDRGKQA